MQLPASRSGPSFSSQSACRKNLIMKVSSSITLPVASSGAMSGNDAVAKLLGQIKELTAKLQSVTSADMDPKAKQEQVKLIQAQITMLYAQIASIQRERQEAQRQATVQQEAAVARVTERKGPRSGALGPGALIDVLA